MSDSADKPTSYRDAGVDLDAAQDTVDRIGSAVEQTRTPGVLSDLGGFGGLFDLRRAGVVGQDGSQPVLVSGADGVGTKLKLAFDLDRHDTIGIDCVAMCVNDVITSGARPLFFLDYFATGTLRPDQAEAVVRGIAEGCEQAECALIGGETAEMPGFYAPGEYDIAGFCVGAVQRPSVISPQRVDCGDTIVGIASSGVHSNGFSLVRKIVADNELDLDRIYPDIDPQRSLGEVLLEPTHIYASLVDELLDTHPPHGLVHVTGGGLVENLPRALPDGLGVAIDASRWPCPDIFGFLEYHGQVAADEMYRVFNMGIGFVVITGGDDAVDVMAAAHRHGFDAWDIGAVDPSGHIDISS